MPNPQLISIIIPAFNEAGSIAQTVRQVGEYFLGRQQPYEVIVSADGTDGTRELVAELAARDPAIRVLGSAERRGKGWGIRQGVALARGEIKMLLTMSSHTEVLLTLLASSKRSICLILTMAQPVFGGFVPY